MESFEKKAWMGQLFDLYGDLLTEKQIAYFKLYYFEDYSLQEIAEVFEVSRNAVFDHIKKAEDHLLEYEQTLKLYEKREKRKSILGQLEQGYDAKLIDELRKLDE
ncbi:MAG TPA: YlxM family DNA-binding protein [Acholeplasmataceae bacterium]|nr:YlxM family DNA-binding protein [Acholeplasmataceae bacterium]